MDMVFWTCETCGKRMTGEYYSCDYCGWCGASCRDGSDDSIPKIEPEVFDMLHDAVDAALSINWSVDALIQRNKAHDAIDVLVDTFYCRYPQRRGE